MRKVLVAWLLAATLTACSADGGIVVRPPDVEVDTPALRAAKDRIGMLDCEPGTGAAVEGGLPEVTLPCLGGGPDVELAALRGPMVINMWQSYCEPCIKEMPALEAFHQQYGDRVAVLGVDSNDVRPAAAMDLARRTGVTYPSLADPGGDFPGVEGFGRVRFLPAWIFVDGDGEVTHVESKAVDSVDEIKELVAQHLGITL